MLSNEDFISKLILKNRSYREGEFEMVSKYEKSTIPLQIKTKYGICKMSYTSLLRGSSPTIESAIDKTSYFCNMVFDKNEKYKEGNFIIIGEYNGKNKRILTQDKYGICSVEPSNLLKGHCPTIKTAIDQTEYWKNMMKDTRGDNFDYNRVIYISHSDEIEIGCKKHGIFFKQRAFSHQHGQICPVCAKETNKRKAPKKEGFAVFYVIKCSSQEESFLKIGLSLQSVEERYNSKNKMPYEYEILYNMECKERNVFSFESKLKRILKEQKYIPALKFSGSKTEVFNLSSLEIIKEEVEKFKCD